MSKNHYDFLVSRRSVLIANLIEPGPGKKQIHKILKAAIRVPDHKIQAPWRFVVFKSKKSREDFGAVLLNAMDAKGATLTDDQIQVEKRRFLRAPVIIGVISSPKEKPGVPDWEQHLSTGAACQNLVNAVAALGFASQWVTEWYAFDPYVAHALDVQAHEKIAGFIYIGTAKEKPKERRRVEVEDVTSYWQKSTE